MTYSYTYHVYIYNYICILIFIRSIVVSEHANSISDIWCVWKYTKVVELSCSLLQKLLFIFLSFSQKLRKRSGQALTKFPLDNRYRSLFRSKYKGQSFFILLMKEIHHLTCIKPSKIMGISTTNLPQLVSWSRISEASTVSTMVFFRCGTLPGGKWIQVVNVATSKVFACQIRKKNDTLPKTNSKCPWKWAETQKEIHLPTIDFQQGPCWFQGG